MTNRSDDNNNDVSIGYQYPTFQLAKALSNAERTGSPSASDKAQKWIQVIDGMFSGTLNVGSRTPVSGTPAWATLEVVTGGFATGNLLAGGDLQEYETSKAASLGFPINQDTRALLNSYYLSEPGIEELNTLLSSGCYRVDVPEEGALLIVAWLLKHNESQKALSILDEISLYFDQLRFYPRPTDQTELSSNEVYLQNAGETIQKLQQIEPNKNITAQENSIRVWLPFYDNMVQLFLQTVDGELPGIDIDENGKPIFDQGRYTVSGGYPFSKTPANWYDSAKQLLDDYEAKLTVYPISKRLSRIGSQFNRLVTILKQCVDNHENLSKSDIGYLRLALARYLNKHDSPESARNKQLRAEQNKQCELPKHTDIAAVLSDRLAKLPKHEGIADLSSVIIPITDEEATKAPALPASTTIPKSLLKKVGRAQLASVEKLVQLGYISSADMLAIVLPQITSDIRAACIEDDELKHIYRTVYCAFRRRRSLLLLNLESQVKITELPWISNIESFRKFSPANTELARLVLKDITILAITYFPHAILPNKLLQELRSLIEQAKITAPLVDEVAADIFMGHFSPKFAQAALIAGDLLNDTLYAKYYGLDYSRLSEKPTLVKSFFKRGNEDTFSSYCHELAGPDAKSGWSVATNGLVIEQQQILTTQNLAALFSALNLKDELANLLSELALKCFQWICHRQQLKLNDYHAMLVVMKNTAYAWRQMIFYMSFLTKEQNQELKDQLLEYLYKQQYDYIKRFEPIVNGLITLMEGKNQSVSKDIRFLGWTVGKHPLMPRSFTSKNNR